MLIAGVLTGLAPLFPSCENRVKPVLNSSEAAMARFISIKVDDFPAVWW
jgi:hypothetical protein